MVVFYLNTNMKFILVILFCMGQDCQVLIGERFETYENCMVASKMTVDMMMEQFPLSNGEIHCMDQKSFNEFMGVQQSSA